MSAMRAGALQLDISFAARKPWVPSRRQLRIWVAAALKKSRLPLAVSLRIVGPATSRRLNAKYRRKNKPTNVLSFAGPGKSADGRQWLGELVICAAVIAREAAEQGKTLAAHWAHITVHGVLHLLGHDHESEEMAAVMEALEAQILDRLGFLDPYV
jgi:probable rRNA maturation factor